MESIIGTWRCTKCRHLIKQMKCLTCGDRLPRWIEEGKITHTQRISMSDNDYWSWHQREWEELEVQRAVENMKDWFSVDAERRE